MSQVNVTYTYKGNITDAEKDTITNTVDFNLEKKMSQYLQKLAKKEDADIISKITIEKNAKRLFNGIFVLDASGHTPLRYEREDFTELTDLINHAFDHFKESLASA